MFKDLLNKKLPRIQGTKAVIGWFIEDREEILPFGNFGTQSPQHLSFQIGSVTKLFTATLAAILISKDALDLNARIGDIIDIDPNSTIKQIVIEDLLTHHSGLPSAPKALLGKYDPGNPYQHVTREKLTTFIHSYRKPLKSGKQFGYSNLGYSLLGYIMEEVTGQTYEELVLSEICQPLKISDLWITQPGKDVSLAPGAVKRKQETPRWELNAIGPAGAIDANVSDMLKFARGNLKGHPFYEKCQPCHQVRHTLTKNLGIGFGWLITQHKEIGELHSHNGATGGFNSFFGIHPERRFGVVVLTNCSLSFLSTLGLAKDVASAIGFEGIKYLAKHSKN